MERMRRLLARNKEFFPAHAKRQFNDDPRIGKIKGVEVGDTWKTREEVFNAKVHTNKFAGISGSKTSGAFSVVLSGGYEDDVDDGEVIIYTGTGGRDDRHGSWGGSKKQTGPQTFAHDSNRALQVSFERQRPIRVVRGFQVGSPGEMEYRYDGLYDVVEARLAKGRSGHQICQFKFVRQKDQDPLPE